MNIVDSTLRDGMYGEISPILSKNIPYVSKFLSSFVFSLEAGSPFSLGYGLNGYTYDVLRQDLRVLNVVRDNLTSSAKLTTFIQPVFFPRSEISSLRDSSLDYVRVGLDLASTSFLESSRPFLEELAQQGIPFALNIMKFHLTTLPHLCACLNDLLSVATPHSIYLVDSSGCLSSEYLLYSAQLINTQLAIPVGLHVHNNQGEASLVSRLALDRNYFADGTLLGRGRTGGNCDTAHMVLYQLSTTGAPISRVQLFIDEYKDLLERLAPLDYIHDYISSLIVLYTGIHSSFINKCWKPSEKPPRLEQLLTDTHLILR